MIDVITEAILIAVLALVVAYFCYLAFIYFVDNIEDDTDMDFYDSMELSKLPIIKMHSNGQVITFLLDTGADCSCPYTEYRKPSRTRRRNCGWYRTAAPCRRASAPRWCR